MLTIKARNALPAPRFTVKLSVETDSRGRTQHFYPVWQAGKDPEKEAPDFKFPGVTGRLQWIGGQKTQMLMAWAASQVGLCWHQTLSDILAGRSTIEQGIIDATYMEARGAAIRARDTAAELGTDGHAVFEKICWNEPYSIEKEARPEIRECVRSFADFWGSLGPSQPATFATEVAIASPTHKFGGSVDFVGKDSEGEWVICDWKSGRLHDEAALQLGAYTQALYETYGITVSSAAAVRVPIDGSEVEVHWVKNLDKSFAGWIAAQKIETCMSVPQFKEK